MAKKKYTHLNKIFVQVFVSKKYSMGAILWVDKSFKDVHYEF